MKKLGIVIVALLATACVLAQERPRRGGGKHRGERPAAGERQMHGGGEDGAGQRAASRLVDAHRRISGGPFKFKRHQSRRSSTEMYSQFGSSIGPYTLNSSNSFEKVQVMGLAILPMIESFLNSLTRAVKSRLSSGME